MRIEEALARLREAAALAASRGSLIFHLDLATEVARSALTADGITTTALATLVDPSGYRVLALDLGAAARVLAVVRFGKRGEAQVDPAGVPASPLAEAIARARRTVSEAPLRGGAERFTPIVLPSTLPGEKLQAYALAVDPAPGAPVLHGHRRLTLAPDGRSVIDQVPLTAGSIAKAAGVLTVDDAVPGELHSYLSLKHGAPLLVDTAESGLRWQVDGERTDIVRK